ncbi:MAG: lytic transglycosylase domain-containing protein [Clostridia bacterium]|nr:lytic transglycosylase domain-containing protein [Clostridia bacterium]
MKRLYLSRKWPKMLVYLLILAVLLYIVFIWSNTELHRRLPLKYEEFVTASAQECGLDPYLVYAVISAESSFEADAVSGAGAQGLMQLMPETAAWIASRDGLEGGDLLDAQVNIQLGCHYLAYLSQRFGGDITLVLAAYNGGEGNVDGWLKKYSSDGKTLTKIPYKETAQYVKKVSTRYELYTKLYA